MYGNGIELHYRGEKSYVPLFNNTFVLKWYFSVKIYANDSQKVLNSNQDSSLIFHGYLRTQPLTKVIGKKNLSYIQRYLLNNHSKNLKDYATLLKDKWNTVFTCV